MIEQIAILGLPTEDQLRGMSKSMSQNTIDQVHKLDNIQARDFAKIIANDGYHVSTAKVSFLLTYIVYTIIEGRR